MSGHVHMVEYDGQHRPPQQPQPQQQRQWQAPWGGPSRPVPQPEPRYQQQQSWIAHQQMVPVPMGDVRQGAGPGAAAYDEVAAGGRYNSAYHPYDSALAPYADPAQAPGQSSHPHKGLVVLTDLPRGAGGEDPSDYSSPYSSGLRSVPSHQHLLEKQGAVRSPPSAYAPPAAPAAQHSARAPVMRDKSIRDRYTRRNAGGDSGMGECCGGCCGGCLHCACCSACSAACCCLGPIFTTILVILALVGIALALYFNWDKITKSGKPQAQTPEAPAHTGAAALVIRDAAAAAVGGRAGAWLRATLQHT
ncbi:hypothetical protein H4R18_004337 [Coemansia javaensis]|uniref:Uncharacterized protein n=1 Tax=Coemansia javaensis TaxID=2761396 RepID=A0A9W8LGD8_9FUNG|nr:hypothetical protein H4R18_004337 [Coemansia javaensis]